MENYMSQYFHSGLCDTRDFYNSVFIIGGFLFVFSKVTVTLRESNQSVLPVLFYVEV